MDEAEWAAETALSGESVDVVRRRYLRDIPVGRFCSPADVGAPVAWLASTGRRRS